MSVYLPPCSLTLSLSLSLSLRKSRARPKAPSSKEPPLAQARPCRGVSAKRFQSVARYIVYTLATQKTWRYFPETTCIVAQPAGKQPSVFLIRKVPPHVLTGSGHMLVCVRFPKQRKRHVVESGACFFGHSITLAKSRTRACYRCQCAITPREVLRFKAPQLAAKRTNL